MRTQKKMHTTLSLQIDNKAMTIEAETTEDALLELQSRLPEDCRITSCLSCRHGHFCPVGNNDNELFCVTEFEPKNKRDLYKVTEPDEEKRKRSRNLFSFAINMNRNQRNISLTATTIPKSRNKLLPPKMGAFVLCRYISRTLPEHQIYEYAQGISHKSRDQC